MPATLSYGMKNADVGYLQGLLNRKLFPSPNLTIDNHFGNKTKAAVQEYQKRNSLTADGVVGAKTWNRLLLGESGGPPSSTGGSTQPPPPAPTPTPSNPGGTSPSTPAGTTPESTADFWFPFKKLPSLHWTGGSRWFGAKRSNGRLHAGNDLVFPQGTDIHAIADGTVEKGPYTFTKPPDYVLTHALEIRHGKLLLRYAEIEPKSFVGGTTVKKGQVIAKVGGLKMLHLEVYIGNLTGGLTDRSRQPYQRRADVTDPNPYLQLWSKNLPK